MKTTLNLPEALYKEIKIKAVREGVPVTELVVKGLQMLLAVEGGTQRRVDFPLIPARGDAKPITLDLVRQVRMEMDDAEDRAIAVSSRR